MDPILFDNARMDARAVVMERYRIENMVDAVEEELRAACGR